jgi:aspartyl protease family protein
MRRLVLLTGAGLAALFLAISWLVPGVLRGLPEGSGLLALLQIVAMLVIVGPTLFTARARGGEGPDSLREGVTFALIWGGILLFLMAAYSQRDSFTRLWADLRGEADPALVQQRGEALVIRRSGDGHFWARIDLNGVPVRGMIDTGASGLALARDDAAAAGIDVDRLDYSVEVSTAAGPSRSAPALVRSLRFGPVEATGLPVLVLPPGVGSTLIGQDVLRGFREITTRGDEMVLVP